MRKKKNKISNGLAQFLKSGRNNELRIFDDVFVQDPSKRNSYLESFTNALVVELSNNKQPC
ncbi:MAG: hypothetical protein OEY56_07365 [Cyclobacteriaceae bacterium]|nr:hypothetical protein [Cyclobacteriaceae bacterium]